MFHIPIPMPIDVVNTMHERRLRQNIRYFRHYTKGIKMMWGQLNLHDNMHAKNTNNAFVIMELTAYTQLR